MKNAQKKPLEITLRRLQREDFPLLEQWINTPHVARWWSGLEDASSIAEKYGPRLSPESLTQVFIIENASAPIGMIQYYRHSDYPDWECDVAIEHAAGIDYLIGEPAAIGRGAGSAAIRLMTSMIFDLFSDIESVVSVPQTENTASCRALEKSGFQLVSQRKPHSECPSDAGRSSIYIFRRKGT